jgi:Uma2 family endonuclease
VNVQLNLRMDKTEFLAWVQAHEGRYELAGSRVVMITGGSRGHAILVRRLAAALEKRLDGNRWTVLTSDFGVDLGPSTVRYPDVVVDVAGGRFKDLTATAPALVAEVLSPSSVKDDLGPKADEYVRPPSLWAYLVLAQDEPKAWVWMRRAAGFPPEPEVVKGRDAVVVIPSLSVDLPPSRGAPDAYGHFRKRGRVSEFERSGTWHAPATIALKLRVLRAQIKAGMDQLDRGDFRRGGG